VLANNSFSVRLPESYARLTTLTVLDVSNNAFSGTLPATWVSLRKLEQLDMSTNALVSPIPEAWLYLYVGSGSQLRCVALFGSAGLSRTELTELKSKLEQRSERKGPCVWLHKMRKLGTALSSLTAVIQWTWCVRGILLWQQYCCSSAWKRCSAWWVAYAAHDRHG
jgi:hypothetical protein